jgi:hypothetical protein
MANGSRSRDLDDKEPYWTKQVTLWKRSGLSQAAFCREYNLSLSRFLYWRKKLMSSSEEAVSFVKLPAISIGSTSSHALSLTLGDFYRVEVTENFDEATFRRLLDILEERRQP